MSLTPEAQGAASRPASLLHDAIVAHREAWTEACQYGWVDQNHANDVLWAVVHDGR